MALPTVPMIQKRIADRKGHDLYDFEWPQYLDYLPPDEMRQHLRNDMQDNAEAIAKEHTREGMLKIIKEYLPHAIDWAEREMALETERCLSHFIAWTWLAGDFKFAFEIQYGLPKDFVEARALYFRIALYYDWRDF